MLDSSNPLDAIPREVWLNIFRYGVIEDFVKVHDISQELEKAFCIHIKHEFSSLRHKILQGINSLQSRLKTRRLSDEFYRLMIIKSILYLRYMSTELNVLFCTVKRYFTHDDALMLLCPHLLPVIKEFYQESKRAVNVEMGNENINCFTVRLRFRRYFEFLKNFDDVLEDQISAISNLTPFEINAIDVLTCCSSINSQMSIMRKLDKNTYNICYFCFFHNLKPISQVPDVHNANLSVKKKLRKLICYLRECTQYENLLYLQGFIDDITFMEFRLNAFALDESMSAELVSNLTVKYDFLQNNVYRPIERHDFTIQYENYTNSLEHYCREATFDQSLTGISVTITCPDQPLENLPLAVHSLRKRTGFSGEVVTENIEEEFSLNKLEDNMRHLSYKNRGMQLCIYFQEGYNSLPSEAVIDVAYDSSDECHVSLNIIRGDPVTTTDEVILID